MILLRENGLKGLGELVRNRFALPAKWGHALRIVIRGGLATLTVQLGVLAPVKITMKFGE